MSKKSVLAAFVVFASSIGASAAPAHEELVADTSAYRRTGRTVALERAKKAADSISAGNAKVPADAAGAVSAALLQLSAYVDAGRRERYRAYEAKHLAPSRGEESEKQLKAIADVERDIAPYLEKLPDSARIPGDDQKRWMQLSRHPVAAKILKNAKKTAEKPVPDTSDELYLEYWKSGDRSGYQYPYFSRVTRLVEFTVAAALDRRGRYIKDLVETVDAICEMKSWVLPAHDHTDGGRGNFKGTVLSVDLFSSEIAAHLACTVNFLGDRLPPETAARIRAEVERRVFAPARLSYSLMNKDGRFVGGRPKLNDWWMCGANNWNAVCHDNLVTAALGLIEDKKDRAFFVSRALRGLKFYEKGGFAADGYCSEGMGYWNYGYGHLLMLGLTLRDVTGGAIDIFGKKIYRKAAEYAHGYELERGVSPVFADGSGAPDVPNLALVRRVWPDLTREDAENLTPFGGNERGHINNNSDRYVSLFGFSRQPRPSGAKDRPLPLRTQFPVGQVWLMRAGKDLSVAVKGGHNDEHHNHNDIGSYYLVSNGKLLSGDPGGERYTSRTFSGRRYQSKVLNSYGHPVPVVAGKLQSTGRRFRAKVISTEFTPERDTVVLDIAGAYNVKTLRSLVRTFVFDRKTLTFSVTDKVVFSEPSEFEEAYTTFEGERFGEVDVDVQVKRGGKTIRSTERIKNPRRIEPDRHSIKFAQPVTEAEITLVFKAK